MMAPMAKNPEHRDLFPGALEIMILQSLRLKPMHGYSLVKHIKLVSENLLQVEEGSLYPALQRMLKEGWLEAEAGIWTRKLPASKECSPVLPAYSPLPEHRRFTMPLLSRIFSRRRRYDDISVSIEEHIE